jgi:hypothetical protein
MAITAIAGTASQQTNPYAEARQAFSQLASALQSGDLSGAQQAYATLASSPAAQGNSPSAQALQKIGQDLQSGDLADAQKALASLQHARGHHHHHGAKPAEQPNSTDQSQTSNTQQANANSPDGDISSNTVNLTA